MIGFILDANWVIAISQLNSNNFIERRGGRRTRLHASDGAPMFQHCARWATYRIRRGKSYVAHALPCGLIRRRAADIPGLAGGVSAHYKEIIARFQPAVSGSCREENDISRLHSDFVTSFTSQRQATPASCKAKHFVCR